MDGDPVGASVGLRGAFEGDWLGLDDGCSDMKVDSKKYHVKVSFKMSIHTYSTHNIYNRKLTALDGETDGPLLGLEEGGTDGPLLGLCEGVRFGLVVGC